MTRVMLWWMIFVLRSKSDLNWKRNRGRVNRKIRNLIIYIMRLPDHDIPTLILNWWWNLELILLTLLTSVWVTCLMMIRDHPTHPVSQTIINIFLSKQKYFMINIRMSCRIRWAVGASWKIRPILHKRIFSAPVTSQSRCQIVYEIKTNDLCVKCGNFVNFPLFCNKLFSLSWGE